MDPNFITASDWIEIGRVLTFLFAVPGSVILFAFPLLIARAIIPSLVGTGHLPAIVLRLRIPLHLMSAVALVILIWVFFNLLTGSEIIGEVYPRWWI